MGHLITLIEGDGIGPEVVRGAMAVIEASRVNIKFDEQPLGLVAIEQGGNPVPKRTLDSIRTNGVALKGPTTTPVGGGHKSANVTLRKELDLYSCVRPAKSIPTLETRFKDVDLVVIRENTEGLYSGQELEIQPGCVVSLRIMTEKGCKRIARAAFDYARKYGRQKVTAVHKANILKLGDGLLLACADEVRKDYPDIAYEEIIIDAFCMKLVSDPSRFDVFFMENMFGDIVSDLCAGLIGGLGLLPGANLSDKCAVFEAVHGSAPDIAGQDLANPTALIQSSILMLQHLGEHDAASRIERALLAVLAEKHLRTRDLGGTSGTKEFIKNIINRL